MVGFQADRWEHGSEFHWLNYSASSPVAAPWNSQNNLYGSGRDALRTLIRHGSLMRDWQRLWIPSYFCQEVVASLLTKDIDLVTYGDGPTDITPDLNKIAWKSGDVLLLVNFFGLRTRPLYETLPNWIEIIEDHTHDPWSIWAYESRADWCMASLRKTLPLGSGGVLWSPVGHSLPDASPLTSVRYLAALEKLAAMVLKTQYLRGSPIEKNVFRSLQLSSEEHIASGPVSAMPEWAAALISTFPVALWREQRRVNYLNLAEALAGASWVRILRPQDNTDTCPYAAILVFDTPERRAHLLRQLVAAGVYPAILWQLENLVAPKIRDGDRDFSRRMLAIHCDARYTPADMQKVATLVLQFGAELDL